MLTARQEMNSAYNLNEFLSSKSYYLEQNFHNKSEGITVKHGRSLQSTMHQFPVPNFFY
jgi:hypothetical protein